MITKKQKEFILENMYILDNEKLQEIIECLIDNMSKNYASRIIKKIIEELNDASNYLGIEDIW